MPFPRFAPAAAGPDSIFVLHHEPSPVMELAGREVRHYLRTAAGRKSATVTGPAPTSAVMISAARTAVEQALNTTAAGPLSTKALTVLVGSSDGIWVTEAGTATAARLCGVEVARRLQQLGVQEHFVKTCRPGVILLAAGRPEAVLHAAYLFAEELCGLHFSIDGDRLPNIAVGRARLEAKLQVS